jgi:hypothetical protein
VQIHEPRRFSEISANPVSDVVYSQRSNALGVAPICNFTLNISIANRLVLTLDKRIEYGIEPLHIGRRASTRELGN